MEKEKENQEREALENYEYYKHMEFVKKMERNNKKSINDDLIRNNQSMIQDQLNNEMILRNKNKKMIDEQVHNDQFINIISERRKSEKKKHVQNEFGKYLTERLKHKERVKNTKKQNDISYLIAEKKFIDSLHENS